MKREVGQGRNPDKGCNQSSPHHAPQSTLSDGLGTQLCWQSGLPYMHETLGSVPSTVRNWARWHMIAFSVRRMQRQEYPKFIVILSYTVSLKLASGDPVSRRPYYTLSVSTQRSLVHFQSASLPGTRSQIQSIQSIFLAFFPVKLIEHQVQTCFCYRGKMGSRIHVLFLCMLVQGASGSECK